MNQHEAHATGDKFILRFEDNQKHWVKRLGREAQQRFAQRWLEDFEWLGIVPDAVVYQSEREERISRAIKGAICPTPVEQIEFMPWPRITWSTASPYPLDADYLVAEVVCNDMLDGVGHMIVGEELLSRAMLYDWFRRALGFPFVQQTYLPRLRAEGELSDVSKTSGNWKISDMRERGMTPNDVLNLLCVSCLVSPLGVWDWRNVKPQPRIEA